MQEKEDTRLRQTAQDLISKNTLKEFVREFWIRLLGGIALIVGIISLFIPLLPGILLTLVGLFLLSIHSRWFRRHLQWTRRQHPYLHRTCIHVERHVFRYIIRKPKDYDSD